MERFLNDLCSGSTCTGDSRLELFKAFLKGMTCGLVARKELISYIWTLSKQKGKLYVCRTISKHYLQQKWPHVKWEDQKYPE